MITCSNNRRRNRHTRRILRRYNNKLRRYTILRIRLHKILFAQYLRRQKQCRITSGVSGILIRLRHGITRETFLLIGRVDSDTAVVRVFIIFIGTRVHGRRRKRGCETDAATGWDIDSG